MFSVWSALNSPTTAHTFEVPISRPTIMVEAGSNMFLPGAQAPGEFRRGGRKRVRIPPFGGDVVGHGQIQTHDPFAEALRHLARFAPAAKLFLEIRQPKSDFASL